MKKILLLIFIGVSILCQATETNLVDADSASFPYVLKNVEGSGNTLRATIFDKRESKTFTVKKGDRLKSLDESEAELTQARDFISSTMVDKKKREILKDMKNDFSKYSIPVPDFSLLHLDPLEDFLNISDKELQSNLAYLEVIDIQNDHILIKDPFRHINFKLYKNIENNQTFSKELNFKDIQLKKVSVPIMVDSIRDNDYGPLIKLSDCSLSGAYDDKYMYLYIEYDLKEPTAKHSDIYFMSYNEETLSMFYEGIKFPSYLEFDIMLSDEKEYIDYINGKRSEVDIDLWKWEYANNVNKNIPDFYVNITRNKKKLPADSDMETDNIKDSQGRNNYIYIKPDKGSVPSVFTFAPDFEQFRPISKIFIPAKINFNPTESQKDIIISSYLNNDNKESPFYQGKIRIELKRKLNTGNKDDIKISSGSTMLFKFYRPISDSIGFNDSFRLNF